MYKLPIIEKCSVLMHQENMSVLHLDSISPWLEWLWSWTQTKCWWECRGKGTFIAYWWECELVQSLRGSVWMSQNPGQSTIPMVHLDNFLVSEGTDSAHNSDSCMLALFTVAELYNPPAYVNNGRVTQSSRCHNWMNKENEIVIRRKKLCHLQQSG